MAEESMWRHTFEHFDTDVYVALIRGAGHFWMLKINMSFSEGRCVAALVYEHLMKIDTPLPQIFQKKIESVSIHCMVYYALIFEVSS